MIFFKHKNLFKMTDIIRIANINNYRLEINNNDLILTPINNYLTEEELLYKNDVTGSDINYCIITDDNNNIISNNSKYYFTILLDIYKSIPASVILQNTTFNIKLTNKNGINGYNWKPEINMSIQHKDAKGTLKEIINMVKINNYKIHIDIINYSSK
jgi:hypothetical protein